MLVASWSVILSLSLLFCKTFVNQQNSAAFWWDWKLMLYAVCFVILLLWLLGTPRSYFWFRMVRETEAYMAHPVGLVCETARLATATMVNGLATYEAFHPSLHYVQWKLREFQRDWERWIVQLRN